MAHQKEQEGLLFDIEEEQLKLALKLLNTCSRTVPWLLRTKHIF